MPAFCRDCFRSHIAHATCRTCQSRRIIAHEELHDLAIAHVDCDAFYASIEKRDNPELRDHPLIVGGETRGVVTTCCYLARIKGVRSAMPMFQAKKLCPDAKIVRPDFGKYRMASLAIREKLERLTPIVEPLSLDEAYLDLTGTTRLHGQPPALLLSKLCQEIERDIGITISVGLSHNKFLAKLASDMQKPRGFAIIGKTDTEGFLCALPVGKLHGVGKVFEKKLNNDGIYYVNDVKNIDPVELMKRYGQSGAWLARLATGNDPRRLMTAPKEKSISTETTFNTDLTSRDDLEHALWNLAEDLSQRLKKRQLAPRLIGLKMKTAAFQTLSRQTHFSDAVIRPDEIFDAARWLLQKVIAQGPFRLMGIRSADFVPLSAVKQDLFNQDTARRNSLDQARDNIRTKFGKNALIQGRSFRK